MNTLTHAPVSEADHYRRGLGPDEQFIKGKARAERPSSKVTPSAGYAPMRRPPSESSKGQKNLLRGIEAFSDTVSSQKKTVVARHPFDYGGMDSDMMSDSMNDGMGMSNIVNMRKEIHLGNLRLKLEKQKKDGINPEEFCDTDILFSF